jgi:hypothetical protein
MVLTLCGSRDDLVQMGPYYAYGIFAGQVKPRIHDDQFLKSVGLFVDELAQNTDPLLKDLLITGILERVADDRYTAATFRYYINVNAQQLLSEVEQTWFGRTSGSDRR